MFGRRTRTAPFWRRSPVRTRDLDELYRYGISCIHHRDGPGMMQVGWALWDAVGLSQRHAVSFLLDGFGEWGQVADVDEQQAFLEEVFERATAEVGPDTAMDGDLAVTVCWSGMRLVDLAQLAGADDLACVTRLLDALEDIPRTLWTPEALAMLRRR